MGENLEIIKSELVKLGFVQDGDTYTFKSVKSHRMSVNGREMIQNEEIIISLTYLGDGYVEDTDGSNHNILYGWSLSVDGESMGGFWVETWDDLKNWLKF